MVVFPPRDGGAVDSLSSHLTVTECTEGEFRSPGAQFFLSFQILKRWGSSCLIETHYTSNCFLALNLSSVFLNSLCSKEYSKCDIALFQRHVQHFMYQTVGVMLNDISDCALGSTRRKKSPRPVNVRNFPNSAWSASTVSGREMREGTCLAFVSKPCQPPFAV